MIPGGDISNPAFWTSLWAGSRASSLLCRTQHEAPERWTEFYDAAARDWDAMSGTRGAMGRRAVEILTQPRGPVRRGAAALDVGSGPGSLSLAMTRAGLRVTALDDSAGMLEELRRQARRRGLRGIRAVCLPWTELRPRRRFDLVAAASFPTAWSPEGLERLESLSRGWCCLTVGVGGDPFPLRRLLWDRIMRKPLPPPGPALSLLFNWLFSTGRKPNLVHVAVPARLDVKLERAVRFYAAYFTIFGRGGPAVERAIRSALERHAGGGRLRASGTSAAAVLWWPVPRPDPCRP